MKKAAILILALALVFAMIGPASAGTVLVKAGVNGNHFGPAKKTVARGTKVAWKNVSGVTHTVTAYSKNWSKKKSLAPGTRTSFTFSAPGTYKYRCTIHSTLTNGVCSGMCGVIKVG